MPAVFTEAVLREACVLVAGVKSVARRPLARVDVKPGWRRFTAMETASYGSIVAVLLLLIALEAPAVHLIVGAVMEDGALRAWIRGLLIGSSLYLALWLMGDLRLLRETPGVLLGKDVLVVELGLQVSGRVGLENVVGAQLLATHDGRADDRARAIRITPLPPPNCRIQLRSAVVMRGIFGISLRGDVLDMYVDDPAGFVAAVEAATAATSVG